MAQQFIFTMKDLRKVYPPNREVLKEIWLSFLPGAKIGVLGANGAGKSTLLKIMAGLEKEFLGEAFPEERVYQWAEAGKIRTFKIGPNVCARDDTLVEDLTGQRAA